jgi:hypothetical protein
MYDAALGMTAERQGTPRLDPWLERLNAGMAVFDLGLGALAIAAPRTGLRLLGHRRPADDAAWLFRRCGPIWLTFAAGHVAAARRGEPRDWWALAWLRGTEIATDALWAQSPAFRADRRARQALRLAGIANIAMAVAFGLRGTGGGLSAPTRPRTRPRCATGRR